MNRELLFRVWTGIKMEYNVGISNHGAFYCSGIDPHDIACLGNTTLYDKNYPVMQYTGLQDSNGKKIFEGDILKQTLSDVFIGVVVYNIYYNFSMASAGYVMFPIENYKNHNFIGNFIYPRSSEILGNIYEHPHLLEKNYE
jgi:uncharacterized phage protein (TIGR01671 family)